MQVKICGLKYRENVQHICELNPEFIGFIFYSNSKRYVGSNFTIPGIPKSTKKVGVFVNEKYETVVDTINKYGLDAVQLHGDETVEYCENLRPQTIVIKAFSIESKLDLANIKNYDESCDLALLDTKSNQYGGSGKSFNWSLLRAYDSKLNFLLSGGLGLENIASALEIKHSKMIGFDLNSRLEDKPGLKSVEITKNVIKNIREK